ncbi:MAG: ribosome-associated translation inhibitor RaiA [Candidatus Hydrogenedentes bacterium]|nr:ribosome-associated translation inhibitor RaiA [Candidatus Hydrogenedentota bacterium]
MNITITGRHLEIKESLRERVQAEAEHFQEHVPDLLDLHIVLSVEKRNHLAEVTASGPGKHFHATASTADLYASVQEALSKVEKQVTKDWGQKIHRRRAVRARSEKSTAKEVEGTEET